MDDYDTVLFPADSVDLDLSFTSCTSAATTVTSTLASSSARTSLARSSLCLSFNESRLSSASASASAAATTVVPNLHPRPHCKSDSHWAAIQAATALSTDGTLHLSHLKLIHHLGSGNLGRVFLCRLRDYDHASFALKVVDKNALTSKKLSHVQTEAQILSTLDHPFLPTLYAHLEVSHYSCFLIDYCPNGDLHSLLHKQPRFQLPVHSVRFFTAEVLVALEYLHGLGIIYRDLKPENILIRADGHIMLSDFDLCFYAEVAPKLDNRVQTRRKPGSKYHRISCYCYGGGGGRREGEEEMVMEFVAEPTTAFSRACVGTHEYLAPELVGGNGHGNGVDWWAFGVLVYELLYGTTPFKGGNKETTLRNIASTRGVRFDEGEGSVVREGEMAARDLIEKLLVKDPRRRLGCERGATDIKRHPFFNGIKWPLIRTYKPPEVRGLAVGRNGGKAGHVRDQRRRRWCRKGLSYLLLKNKGSRRNLNSNHNYYCYNNNNKYRVRKYA